jgi:hypothetical protein
MDDDPNLELLARFARLKAARLRRPRKERVRLVERLTPKLLAHIQRRMPATPPR